METLEQAIRDVIRRMNTDGATALEGLDPTKTALLIVDMINGFAIEGSLSSPRVAGISQKVACFLSECSRRGILSIAFADCHPEDSPEFVNYPPHCIAGSSESEVVEEIKAVGGYTLIPKNSTNAIHERAFQEWLENHPEVDTFILTGCCTDICVLQLAMALKTFFNSKNIKSRVIVPRDLVETYDAPGHSAGLMNNVAFLLMQMNGIEIPDKIIDRFNSERTPL